MWLIAKFWIPLCRLHAEQLYFFSSMLLPVAESWRRMGFMLLRCQLPHPRPRRLVRSSITRPRSMTPYVLCLGLPVLESLVMERC